MPMADVALIAWTAACLILAALLAKWRPEWWLWAVADRFYYPLAAVGVVLLFLASDANRTLLDLTARKSALQTAWSNDPNPRPNVSFDAGSTELLDARYGWFRSVVDLGKACSLSASPDCAMHERHARLVERAFGDFNPSPGSDDPADRVRKESEYCELGERLVDQFGRETLLSQAVPVLRSGFAKVGRGEGEEYVEQRVRAALLPRQETVRPDATANPDYAKLEPTSRPRYSGALLGATDEIRRTFKAWTLLTAGRLKR